jgi:peptide/nickel transport system permease protein
VDTTYFARRGLQFVVVLWLLVTILFVLPRLQGDPILLLTEGDIEPAEIEKLRIAYGLDRPVPVQYIEYIGGVMVGDLGTSIRSGQKVTSLIRQRIGRTMTLVIPAKFIALFIAIPLGTIAAVRRGWIDFFAVGMSLLFQSVPNFFVAIMLIFVFGVKLHWLPTFGSGGLEHHLLPVFVLASYPIARYTRLLRAQVTEAMQSDYVRTARAKGLGEVGVVRKHVLRNALLPIVTLIGLDFGTLVGGSIIIETVFAWPGFGSLTLDAVVRKDYPVIQGAGMTIGLMVLLGSLLADIAYGYLDPRIRRA